MFKTRPSRAMQIGAAALIGLAACATAARAEEIRIGGTGSALGTMQLLASAYVERHPRISAVVLPSLGTSGGIKALRAGAIQIALSSRPLKDTEASAGAVATEYGRTPFIFATGSTNKLSSITTSKLAEIYAGKAEQWPDGSKIRLVLRPVGDSDTETIKSMSPAMRDAKTAAEQRPGMLFTVTDQDTADSIEKVPGALGPSTLALMLSEKRAFKALALDGVVPDAQSITDGRYPLFKTMFMITGANPSPAVQGFVAFVRSPAGREILAKTGHWVR